METVETPLEVERVHLLLKMYYVREVPRKALSLMKFNQLHRASSEPYD